MTLTKGELEQFKALYLEHYGIDLTDAQAFDKGTRLVRLLKVVLQATCEEDTRSKNA